MTRTLLAAALLLSLLAQARAQEPGLQTLRLGDFTLESGEVVRDFGIAYMTDGTLNAAKSNVVLMVTAIGGNHHRIDYMIGPGKALDTDRLFVVKTNAIGNGLTTSPSNSAAQRGPDFPHFTIRDMVESQNRLLQHLGIPHLVAVVGASMGGMQVLQWGVSHPEMMDGLIALTPMARTTPWSIAVNHATRRVVSQFEFLGPDLTGMLTVMHVASHVGKFGLGFHWSSIHLLDIRHINN